MKNILSLNKLAVLAAGLASAVSVASATEVTYTYTGETGGGVSMGIQTAEGSVNALVGQFDMTTTTSGFSSPLLTYCTDVGVLLSTTFNYTPTALSSANGVAPAWISGGIQNAATLWADDSAAATTATQTAGMQLAIWELLYNKVGTSYSASTFTSSGNGGFHVTTSNSAVTAAETYAAQILNGFASLPSETGVEWLAPTEQNGSIGGSQGLLYQGAAPTGVPQGVPDASSTLGLLGMAVVALGLAGKKLSVSQA